MVRICRPTVICEMTGDTGCRKTGVDVVLVTRRTLNSRMGAGQRKRCRAVIEGCTGPGSRVVADRALLRKSGLDMIRICRSVEVRQMAGRAVRRETGVDVVLVTGGALHACMGAG